MGRTIIIFTGAYQQDNNRNEVLNIGNKLLCYKTEQQIDEETIYGIDMKN